MAAEVIGLVDEARDVNDEELLTDLCVITRGGEPTWDAVGGTKPGTPTRIVPADPDAPGAPCRVRMPSRLESKEEAGDHLWSLKDAILRLSAGEPGAENVRGGDMVTVTSTVRGVGLTKSYEIVASVEGSHMSSARFVIRRGD